MKFSQFQFPRLSLPDRALLVLSAISAANAQVKTLRNFTITIRRTAFTLIPYSRRPLRPSYARPELYAHRRRLFMRSRFTLTTAGRQATIIAVTEIQ